MFAVLVVSTITAWGQTKTSDDMKPTLWPHGPYDKLMTPAQKPSAMPFIIEPPPGSNQPPKILIYRGTQREAVDITNTNRLAPSPWRPPIK